MFRQAILQNEKVLLLFHDGEYVISDMKLEDAVRVNLKKFPRKVNSILNHVFNQPYVVQDLIDYHMDQDLQWDFIVCVMKVTKNIRKK